MPTIPAIGDVTMSDIIANPYPIYARAQEMGPVVRVEATNLMLVTRFDDIMEVERDPVTYSSENPHSLVVKVCGPNLMRKDGEQHQVERKAVEPSLRPGTAKRCWAPQLEGIVDDIIATFEQDGEADLFDAFASPMAARALVAVLGLGDVEWQTVARWSQAMMDGNGNYGGDPEISRRAKQATDEIEQAIDAMIPYHRENPNESALSSLLQADQSKEQIYGNVKVFIGGGHNEPRDAILTLVLGLLQNPDQLAKVKEDPKLWEKAFEEAVRWIAPIGMYPRLVTQDVELSGVQLKKGDQIGLCIAAANHDRTHFDAPERFDIFRPKQAHLAFGAGAHFCAGTWVARILVSKLAVPRLFERLPNLRLKDPESVKISGWVFRGPTSLPVVWDVKEVQS